MSAGQRVRAAWSDWSGAHELGPYTLGVEEEAMLLDPRTWALAHRIDDLLPRFSVDAQNHVSAETHGSAFEVQTNVRRTVGEAVDDLLGSGSSSRDARDLGLPRRGVGHPSVRDLAGDRDLRW